MHDDNFRNDNEMIEVAIGLILLEPTVNVQGAPIDHIRRACRWKNCVVATKAKLKIDEARRAVIDCT